MHSLKAQEAKCGWTQINASCSVCFEYQRLRKLREFFQSAQTMTGDAMRGQFVRQERNEHDVADRVDLGLRMSVLGLGAAAATIVNAVMQSGGVTSLVIGAGLASTALASLHWLKSATNLQIPFLAASGVWIGGLAFMTSVHPVSALLALAATAVVLGRSKFLRSLNAEPANEFAEHPQSEASGSEDIGILLSRAGTLVAQAQLGDLILHQDEQFVDRVHIADRVEYMRDLSQVRAGEVDALQCQIRVNVAGKGKAALFEAMQLEMTKNSNGVVLKKQTSPVDIEEEAESEETVGSDKRFLAIVSHELRTPLNAIIGFSDVLRSEINGELPDSTRHEYAELIHGAGTHLLSLVNTILDVSKIESGTYSIARDEFDFAETARESMAMLGPQAKQKSISINDRITCKELMAMADRRAIKQILINLLSNAIKYTEPNGFVTVDAQMKGSELVFEVSDTGIGMTEEDLKVIAKPFAQLDNSITRSNEGTGLGLALVKGLVELHDGKLDISSKVGVGTNIRISIPNEVTGDSVLSSLRPFGHQDDPKQETINGREFLRGKEMEYGARKAG